MQVFLAFLAGLRPRQWTKNLIVLFGVVFARQAGETELLLRSLAGVLVGDVPPDHVTEILNALPAPDSGGMFSTWWHTLFG